MKHIIKLSLIISLFCGVNANLFSMLSRGRNHLPYLRKPLTRILTASTNSRRHLLKNGYSAEQEHIEYVMSELIDFAHRVPRPADGAYQSLFSFPKLSHKEQKDVLQSAHIISAADNNQSVEDAIHIVGAALDISHKGSIKIAIVRSPLAGHYLVTPHMIYHKKADDELSIATGINRQTNTLCAYISNTDLLLSLSYQLKLPNEQEPDILSYYYNEFWRGCGFNSYADYLDDRLSWEVSQEEYLKQREEILKEKALSESSND